MFLRKIYMVYLVAIIFCGDSNSVYAQLPSLDTLLLRLKNHPQEDSLRSEYLTDIGYYFRESNHLLAIKYLEEAKELGMKVNTSWFVGGRYLDLGESYNQIGNAKKALSYYLEAEKLFTEIKNKNFILKSYNHISILYQDIKQYEKAEIYIKKSESLINASSPSIELFDIYACKSHLFLEKGLFDSSIVYEKKVIEMAKTMEDDGGRGFSAEMNLGLMYKKKKDYAKAMEVFTESFNNIKNTQDKYFIASLYNNIASTFSEMGNYQEAKRIFDSSLSITIPNEFYYITIENYNNLATMYEQSGNYKQQAIFLKKHFQLKDSLINLANQNQMNQIEQNYVVEMNAKALREQREKNQRYILLASVSALVALGLFIFYRRTKQKNKLLSLQKKEIEKQNKELAALNQTKDKLFRIIGHDLRNPLIALSSYLDHKEETTLSGKEANLKYKKQTTIALLETISLLDNLLTWANSQLHHQEFSTARLELSDIVAEVVLQLHTQASQKDIQFITDFHADADNVITNENILSIVIRNLLSNAIKFSYPGSEVIVSASKSDAGILLQIRDKGIGMNPEQVDEMMAGKLSSTKGTANESGTGLGISIVKDLLGKLNITWTVESQPEKGTVFSLIFEKPQI